MMVTKNVYITEVDIFGPTRDYFRTQSIFVRKTCSTNRGAYPTAALLRVGKGRENIREATMSNAEFILALDQGTGSTRAILYGKDMKSVAVAQEGHVSIKPFPSWVEHDPLVILANSKTCINNCMREACARNISPESVQDIGITNRRETTVVWNRSNREPLYNAVVWNDARTAETVEVLKRGLPEGQIRDLTGLPISTYFSAVKLAWLRANVPAVDEGLKNGTALVGTMDTWLLWHLTAEKVILPA